MDKQSLPVTLYALRLEACNSNLELWNRAWLLFWRLLLSEVTHLPTEIMAILSYFIPRVCLSAAWVFQPSFRVMTRESCRAYGWHYELMLGVQHWFYAVKTPKKIEKQAGFKP
jgi:hypothetical protein